MGPFHADKQLAVQDKNKMKIAYKVQGVEELHKVNRELIEALGRCLLPIFELPQQVNGWEIEIEMNGEGYIKARAHFFVDADEHQTRRQMYGERRRSRTVAEKDLQNIASIIQQFYCI